MSYFILWSVVDERWMYSTNGGNTWMPLFADDYEDSDEAFSEASEKTGVSINEWSIYTDYETDK